MNADQRSTSEHTVRITAFGGQPLALQQATNIAEEMRMAGYDVEIIAE